MKARMLQMGERIKRLREDAGYSTQQSLATALGVSRQNVALWEAGKGMPKWSQFPGLASRLKTDEEYILYGHSPNHKPTQDRRFLSYVSEEEGDLLTAFRSCSDPGRNAILASAKALRQEFGLKGEVLHLAKK